MVDFYADWCPPCRVISPVFSQLADSHAAEGHLAFAKVNVDHVKDIAKRYDISAMPTFVFLKNGKPEPVVVRGIENSTDKVIDRIRGADAKALKTAVLSLANRAGQ